jgi:hypothetical protein
MKESGPRILPPEDALPPGLQCAPVHAMAPPPPRGSSWILTALVSALVVAAAARGTRRLHGPAAPSPKRWATIDLVDMSGRNAPPAMPASAGAGERPRQAHKGSGPASGRDPRLDTLIQFRQLPVGEIPVAALAALDAGFVLELPKAVPPSTIAACPDPVHVAGATGTGGGPGLGSGMGGSAGGRKGGKGGGYGQGPLGGAPDFALREVDFSNIVAPAYPKLAINSRLQDDVEVRICFSEGGRHIGHQFLDGPGIFDEAIESVLPIWQIKPLKLDGRPTKGCLIFVFRFRLQMPAAVGSHG